MKKELEAKVEKLANAFIVSETILRERLKLSNDALNIMLGLSIVDPEKASVLLEALYIGKNQKNKVWILEMKEKFNRIHRLMFEFINNQQKSNQHLNTVEFMKANSKTISELANNFSKQT